MRPATWGFPVAAAAGVILLGLFVMGDRDGSQFGGALGILPGTNLAVSLVLDYEAAAGAWRFKDLGALAWSREIQRNSLPRIYLSGQVASVP